MSGMTRLSTFARPLAAVANANSAASGLVAGASASVPVPARNRVRFASTVSVLEFRHGGGPATAHTRCLADKDAHTQPQPLHPLPLHRAASSPSLSWMPPAPAPSPTHQTPNTFTALPDLPPRAPRPSIPLARTPALSLRASLLHGGLHSSAHGPMAAGPLSVHMPAAHAPALVAPAAVHAAAAVASASASPLAPVQVARLTTSPRSLAEAAPQGAPAASASAPTAGEASITWADYFRLRSQRKSTERISGIVFGVVSFLAAMYYVVVVMPFDPTDLWFGLLSPDIVGALGIILAAVVGWWMGALAGGEIWAFRNRPILRSFTTRDRSFAHHVTSHRAPQQALNVSGQHPDYYAERVDSLRAYHRWLRSQRNYEQGKEQKNVGVSAMLRQIKVPGVGGKAKKA